MTEFRITEPGAYKQHNGGKGEYIGKDSKGRYIGVDSDGDPTNWREDGSHNSWNDYSLIAPWTEPKKIVVDFWVNVYEDGRALSFMHKELAACSRDGRIAVVHIQREVTEGEGL